MTSNKKLGGRSSKVAMVVGGLALVAGLGLAARAYAQQHGDGWQHGPHGGPAAHFAQMCETMDARQAGMLAFAEVRLGITDAERPAWTKFAAAVKAASAPIKQLCAGAGQPEPKTLPERLHRLETMETARLEQLRQITPAVEELYGTLSPKQKELADHLVEGMMHHGPGGPGMHHPGMPGHDAPAKAPN
jgi:periplasmic protein CpxP/Spy